MRLTNGMREEIVRKVIEDGLKDRKEILEQEEDSLANIIYNLVYPASVLAKMNVLPESFFYQKSSVYVLDTDSCRDRIELVMTSSKRIAAEDNNYNRPSVNIENLSDDFRQRIIDLKNKRKAFQKDIRELRDKTDKFVQGLSTSKQLEDSWPEGIQFYKDLFVIKPVVNPPAIRGIEITDLLSRFE